MNGIITIRGGNVEENTLELKAALDMSYESNKEIYQKKYGWSKDDFYKNALKEINNLSQLRLRSISEAQENLSFISRKHRENISKHVFNRPDYIESIYDYVTRNEAKYFEIKIPNEEKINKIIEEFKEMEKESKKRNFFKESDYIDSFLLSVKPERRFELLKRVLNKDMSFNIYFPSSKFAALYNIDLDELKLLLVDNAYRVSVLTSEISSLAVMNMLSSEKYQEKKDALNEYLTNRDILQDHMNEVHNVAEYVSSLDQNDIETLIHFYVLSLNSRRSNQYIHCANTINSGYSDRIEVFKQLENKDTIDEIKRLENQGYKY